MNVYTLTNTFLPKESISEFISIVWTERYSSAGDVQIVAPASPAMIRKLTQGTFLGLRGTKEIMILETQSVEDGLLTVSGNSLPKFLEERQAWFRNENADAGEPIGEYSQETTAGELISSAIEKMVINPVEFTSGAAANSNLDWPKETIPGLELGMVDANGIPRQLTLRIGSLYSAIQQLADAERCGFKLYLNSSSFTGGYVLKFATYRGKDRTSEQSSNQWYV